MVVLRPSGAAAAVLAPAGDGKRQPTAMLPMEPDEVRWARFETVPGEVALACTSSTAALLSREDFRSHVMAEWLPATPPCLPGSSRN
jgi:hypothetical protein